MQQRNFYLEGQNQLAEIQKTGEKPRLLLHSCCAPCSTAVIERLLEDFLLTIYFFNPNMDSEAEFARRVLEQKRFLLEFCDDKVSFLEEPYAPDVFSATIRGVENAPEGGARCMRCFHLRLRQTAIKAKLLAFPYFATTLSVSPHKNARALNEIGEQVGKEVGVHYLYSDFKKKDGYKRSVTLSEAFNLYRQDYCGCIFSKKESELRRKKEAE